MSNAFFNEIFAGNNGTYKISVDVDRSAKPPRDTSLCKFLFAPEFEDWYVSKRDAILTTPLSIPSELDTYIAQAAAKYLKKSLDDVVILPIFVKLSHGDRVDLVAGKFGAGGGLPFMGLACVDKCAITPPMAWGLPEKDPVVAAVDEIYHATKQFSHWLNDEVYRWEIFRVIPRDGQYYYALTKTKGGYLGYDACEVCISDAWRALQLVYEDA